jgi:hypothetical protein
MKRRIHAITFCSYMHIFWITTHLYACKGFAIRGNDGLAIAQLLRTESPLAFLMARPLVRPFPTVPPGLEVTGVEHSQRSDGSWLSSRLVDFVSQMLFSLIRRVRYF